VCVSASSKQSVSAFAPLKGAVPASLGDFSRVSAPAGRAPAAGSRRREVCRRRWVEGDEVVGEAHEGGLHLMHLLPSVGEPCSRPGPCVSEHAPDQPRH